MNLDIKNVLEKIEDNGFEAYVVGGYVRDFLLHIESVDVDICTNALPKDVINIFNIKKETTSYGSISLSNGKYNFDITTYRKESDYIDRRPTNIEYTNNLILDIKRRDFTINSICMNKDGQIFDYLNGRVDLKKRIIRVIGDTNQKLSEDPLRILRALRFATILNFKLDNRIIGFIKNNKNLISSLSYTRRKEELDKILSSKNALKGLKLIKDLDLCNELEIEYDKIVYVNDLLGMWAQINFSDKYPFTKNNLFIINSIRNIVNSQRINAKTLFYNDLYTSTVAGIIIGLNPHKVNKIYTKMPIRSKKDLSISPQEIISMISSKKDINTVINVIIDNILSFNLKNNPKQIKEFIIKNWK